jgi:hypothetical protein
MQYFLATREARLSDSSLRSNFCFSVAPAGADGARAKPGILRSTTFKGSSTQASVMKSMCLTSSVAAMNVTLPRARLAGSAF